jgi:hypothetical protein
MLLQRMTRSFRKKKEFLSKKDSKFQRLSKNSSQKRRLILLERMTRW